MSAAAPTGPAVSSQVIRGSVLANKAGEIVTLYSVSSTGALTKLASVRLEQQHLPVVVRRTKGQPHAPGGHANTLGNAHGEVRFVAKRS